MFGEKETFAEKIVGLIKKEQQGIIETIDNLNIENGFIVIDYEMYELEHRELMDGICTMCMPKEFQRMEDKLAKAKYPNELRPEYIYSDKENAVDFTFTLDQRLVEATELVEIRDNILWLLVDMHPNYELEDVNVLAAEQKEIAFLSFVKPAFDGNIYQLLFFTEIKNRLLIGGFNCNEITKDQWRAVVKQMLQTLRT